MSGRETIFEVRISGAFAQISAIDVETGLEVSVTTPASASRADQHALAQRKLTKMLESGADVVPETNAKAGNGDTFLQAPPKPKPGILA